MVVCDICGKSAAASGQSNLIRASVEVVDLNNGRNALRQPIINDTCVQCARRLVETVGGCIAALVAQSSKGK